MAGSVHDRGARAKRAGAARGATRQPAAGTAAAASGAASAAGHQQREQRADGEHRGADPAAPGRRPSTNACGGLEAARAA